MKRNQTYRVNGHTLNRLPPKSAYDVEIPWPGFRWSTSVPNGAGGAQMLFVTLVEAKEWAKTH